MKQFTAWRRITRNGIAALILFSTVFSLLPTAEAGLKTDTGSSFSFTENFEPPNAAGQSAACCTQGTTPSDSFYTTQIFTSGTGVTGTGTVATSTAIDGVQDWRVSITSATASAGTQSAWLTNSGANVNLCSNGQTFSVKFQAPSLSLSGVGATAGFFITSATPSAITSANTPLANSVGLGLTRSSSTIDSAVFAIDSSGGTVATSAGTAITDGTIHTLTISSMACVSTSQATFQLDNAAPVTLTVAGSITGTLNQFVHAVTAPVAAGGQTDTLDVDDYSFTGIPLPAPTVTAVNPAQGIPQGGQSYTLTGTQFESGAVVKFGGTIAASSVQSLTTITGTTPAHAAGVVSITVTNPDGQIGTLNNGFTYQPLSGPVITSIVPRGGIVQGGTTFTLNGQNFVNGAQLVFGSAQVQDENFVSSAQITGHTPPNSAGTVTVTLTNPDGQSATTPFTYGAPTLTSLNPTHGSFNGGDSVTLTGTNFAVGASTATFASGAATCNFSSTTSGVCTSPAVNAPGTANVVVTNPDGETSGAQTYTYDASGGPAGGTTFTDPAANSGRYASIALGNANKNDILLAHVAGTSSALLATISTNGGTSFNDNIVGPNGLTNANVRLNAFAEGDHLHFVIMYNDGLATSSSNHIFVSANGGTTWTDKSSLTMAGGFSPLPVWVMPMACSGSAPMTCVFGKTEGQPSPCSGNGNSQIWDLLKTTDYFATTTQFYQDRVNYASNCNTGTLNELNSNCDSDAVLYGTTLDLYWCPQTSGSVIVRWRFSNYGSPSSTTVQDQLNSVSGPYFKIQADQYSHDSIAFVQGTATGAGYLGTVLPSGSWRFVQGVSSTGAGSKNPIAHTGKSGVYEALFTTPAANTANPFVKVTTGDLQTVTTANGPSGTHTTGDNPDILANCDQILIAYQDTPTQKLMFTADLGSTNCPPPVSPDATLAGAFNAFDQDPTGTSFIVRYTASPSVVHTGVPKTLTINAAAGDSSTSTNCQNYFGAGASEIYSVISGFPYVSYFGCHGNPGGTSPDKIYVRTTNLANPSCPKNTDGSTATFCSFDVGGVASTSYQLADVAMFPYDYHHQETTTSDPKAKYLEFTYTTTDGYVGVEAVTQRYPYDGSTQAVSYNYDTAQVEASGTVVPQLCSTGEQGGTSFIYAGGGASPVAGYQVVNTKVVDNFQQNAPSLVPHLNKIFSNPATAQAVAIGCGGFRALIVEQPGNVVMFDPFTNAVYNVNTTIPSSVRTRGAAIDASGGFGAYLVGDYIHLVNLTSLRDVQLLPLPDPNLGLSNLIIKVSLSVNGAGLTIASQQALYYWNTAKYFGTQNLVTPVNPTIATASPGGSGFTSSNQPGCAACVTSSAPPTAGFGGPSGNGAAGLTGNPIGQAVAYFNASWHFDGSILFGLAVVCMIVFAFVKRGTGPLLTALGGVIGVAVAFILGLFPLWLLLVIIFLIIAVAGRVLFGGKQEEGGAE